MNSCLSGFVRPRQWCVVLKLEFVTYPATPNCYRRKLRSCYWASREKDVVGGCRLDQEGLSGRFLWSGRWSLGSKRGCGLTSWAIVSFLCSALLRLGPLLCEWRVTVCGPCQQVVLLAHSLRCGAVATVNTDATWIIFKHPVRTAQ